MSVSIDAARAAKAKVRDVVARLVQVQGVGVTRVGDGYAVKVLVLEEPEEPEAIPKSVDGVPVVLEVTGKIRKH